MITLDLTYYGGYDDSKTYFRTRSCEKIYKSKDNMVRLIHGNKTCIVQYIDREVDSCSKCCFRDPSRCSYLAGVSDCGDLPVTCGPGYFKSIDDIMEEL